MGVTNVTLASFKEVLNEKFKGGLMGETVFELGDQMTFIQGQEQVLFKTLPFFDYTEFVNFDIHGKNGVIQVDFRKPMPQKWLNRANILTNFGFTEHVDNQYMAWQNIHNLVKTGGIVISELPGQPNFPGHFEFPYYTTEFFQGLSEKCGYKLLINRYQQHEVPLKGQVVFCVFEKVNDKDFISKEEFYILNIERNDSTGSL